MKRQCETCKKQFDVPSLLPSQKTCSDECRTIFRREKDRRHQRAKYKRRHPKPLPRECDECGRVFMPATRRTRWCSGACIYSGRRKYLSQWARDHYDERKALINARAKARRNLAKLDPKPPPIAKTRTCAECGESFESVRWRKLCSPECNKKRCLRALRDRWKVEKRLGRKKRDSWPEYRRLNERIWYREHRAHMRAAVAAAEKMNLLPAIGGGRRVESKYRALRDAGLVPKLRG